MPTEIRIKVKPGSEEEEIAKKISFIITGREREFFKKDRGLGWQLDCGNNFWMHKIEESDVYVINYKYNDEGKMVELRRKILDTLDIHDLNE